MLELKLIKVAFRNCANLRLAESFLSFSPKPNAEGPNIDAVTCQDALHSCQLASVCLQKLNEAWKIRPEIDYFEPLVLIGSFSEVTLHKVVERIVLLVLWLSSKVDFYGGRSLLWQHL